MQQIDEFPALLNIGKDYGYSLGSQTNHDLCYVPMNWKREMEKVLKTIERKWARNCNAEYQKEV